MMAPLVCKLFDESASFTSAATANGLSRLNGTDTEPLDADAVAGAIQKLLHALPSGESAISNELLRGAPAETALMLTGLMVYHRRR